MRGNGANVLCSYEHHNIEEPAIILGGAFVVDAVEKEKENVEVGISSFN
jgi:hypothetical protein